MPTHAESHPPSAGPFRPTELQPQEPRPHRARWAAIGAAIAVSFGAGAATLPIADAITSSGERAVYTAISPCRLADFRAEFQVGPRSAPLGPNETETLSARGPQGECTATDLPADAVAIQLNVTATDATLPTFLAISPDGSRDSSSLNPVPGAPPTPNAVTVDLAPDGTFQVFNLQGNVNVFFDVTGYYTDHDHDDRYYTEAQVDAALEQLRSDLTAPRVEELAIGPAAFRTLDSGDDSIVEAGFVYISPTASDDAVLVADAPIPDGARLRRLSARIADSTDPTNATVTLVCARPDGGGTAIGTVSTNNLEFGWVTVEAPLTGAADAAACRYYVQVDLPRAGDFAVHRVTIEYETAGG